MRNVTEELAVYEVETRADVAVEALCAKAQSGPRSRRARGVLGQRSSDDRIIHVSELVPEEQRGLRCDCVCPGCKALLSAKLGTQVAHHFAHYNADECPGALETSLHKYGKQLIRERRRVRLPERRGTHNGIEVVLPARDFIAEHVDVEPSLGNLRPDLKLTSASGEVLYVEIRVTHEVDEAKAEQLRGIEVSVIEIDLRRNVASEAPLRELEEAIFDRESNRRWISKPLGSLESVYQAELAARFEIVTRVAKGIEARGAVMLPAAWEKVRGVDHEVWSSGEVAVDLVNVVSEPSSRLPHIRLMTSGQELIVVVRFNDAYCDAGKKLGKLHGGAHAVLVLSVARDTYAEAGKVEGLETRSTGAMQWTWNPLFASRAEEAAETLDAMIGAALTAFFESLRPLSYEDPKVCSEIGFSPERAKRLDLRYCGRDYDRLMADLKDEFGDGLLLSAGLLKRSKRTSRPYPAFFPFRKAHFGFAVIPFRAAGRLIALEGRAIDRGRISGRTRRPRLRLIRTDGRGYALPCSPLE